MGAPVQLFGSDLLGFSTGINTVPAFLPAAGSSIRHSTRMQSEPSANVHQYLLPVMTHSSPSRRARVATLDRSEPVCGSDKAPAPRYSPRTIAWIFSRRSVSVPGTEP